MNHLGDAISALLDGELSPGDERAARTHLATCPTCASELAATEQARRWVRGLPQLSATARALAAARRAARRPVAWVGAAAAAAAVVALMANVMHPAVPRLAAADLGPAQLAASYHRIDAHREAKRVRVDYRDAQSHWMTLSKQTMALSSAVPVGATVVHVGGTMGMAYAAGNANAVSWQRGDLTFTLMGDGPQEDVMTAANSMPAPRPLSLRQRVRRSCRALVERVTALW